MSGFTIHVSIGSGLFAVQAMLLQDSVWRARPRDRQRTVHHPRQLDVLGPTAQTHS